MRYFAFLILVLLLSSGAVNAEIDPMINLDPPDLTFQFPQIKRPDIKMPDIKLPNYAEYQIKKGASNEVIPVNNAPKKESIFSKAKNFIQEKINTVKKPKQRPVFDSVGGGYSGTLPNVESEFEYRKPKNSSPSLNGADIENFGPEDFQNSRIDDPLFLDAILNKGKPSQFTVDMITVMRFLEGFRKVIQNHDDIQKFNANVNYLDLYARKIEKLYGDKPESMTPSYWFLQDLAYKAKVLGNLKYDANYYSKFSPIQGTQYDPENILKEDNKLLIDLDKTVFAIRQLSD